MKRIAPVSRKALSIAVASVVSAWVFSAQAFNVPVHMDITEAGLSETSATVNGEERSFSARTVADMKKANEEVDNISGGSAAYWHPERHFTDEEYSSSSQRILDLRRDALDLVTKTNPDGYLARRKIGQALHTIQDFYAHSNWVERGNTDINHLLGTGVSPNPSRTSQNCPDSPQALGPNGGGTLTSGYFVGFHVDPSEFGCSVEELPANKCFHGNYSINCPGINKDLDVAGAAHEGVSQNPFHSVAARQAADATTQFVQGILDDLSGNDRALSALLDLKGTLGFVVDDTGSMGSSIDGVVSTIDQMISWIGGNPNTKPDNYLFVQFGDPSIGAPLVSDDPAAIRSAVASISPSGGGDCPELSQNGLLAALDAAAPRSHIHLFTDATAKDSGLANQVIARAQRKGARLHYGLTGSCSPVDPAYIRGAEETGGQLFRLDPSEIPQLFTLIQPQLSGDIVTIARRKVDLGTNGLQSIDAPVDSHTSRLIVSSTIVENNVAGEHTVKVFRPSGEQVSASDAGVGITTLGTGVIIRIDAPEAGVWRVELEGYGPLTAAVQGNSDISIDRFDFVEPGGDIHGGFQALPGLPVAGYPALGEAVIFGEVTSARFSFLDQMGNEIQPLSFVQNYPRADRAHYMGSAPLPAVPFRLVVQGEDDTGAAYRREYPAVYRAQSVAIEVTGMDVVEIAPDERKEVSFKIVNHGPAGIFSVVVGDDLGYVSPPTQRSVAVGSEEQVELAVTLHAPADATEGSTTDVTLTATRQDEQDVYNSGQLTAIVGASNHAPACYAPTSQVRLWPPNGKLESVFLEGAAEVEDPDGDPLELVVESITQDEAVSGQGPWAADGVGVGTDYPSVRARRDGNGNGRVYQINYRATDVHGASCAGYIQVGVPQRQIDSVAVDDGQLYNSVEE